MHILQKHSKIITSIFVLVVFFASLVLFQEKIVLSISYIKGDSELDRAFNRAMARAVEVRRITGRYDATDVSKYFESVTSKITDKEFEEYIHGKFKLHNYAIGRWETADTPPNGRSVPVFLSGASVGGWNLLYYNFAYRFYDEVVFGFEYTDETRQKITKKDITLIWKFTFL